MRRLRGCLLLLSEGGAVRRRVEGKSEFLLGLPLLLLVLLLVLLLLSLLL